MCTCNHTNFLHLDCRGSSTSNLPWIIAVAIVGGILLLGLLALIIAKIILVVIVSNECMYMYICYCKPAFLWCFDKWYKHMHAYAHM